MKLGKRNQQKAALMLPWAVLMVLRYANKPRKYTSENQLWIIQGRWIILLRNVNGQQMGTKKKKYHQNFQQICNINIGFSIEIQTNLKEVDFLDVTLNIQNYTYHPYKKL